LRNEISNAQLAELLSREAENSSGIRVRAFRRAARSAFLWPERAADLLASGQPLTELHGIGPFIAPQLRGWIENPPEGLQKVPAIRRDFLTLADAKVLLAAKPDWAKLLRGDLQMHSRWSDGSGTIEEMVIGGRERGYEYLAITDHSKGLKIAGGIDEKALAAQAVEINVVNHSLGAKSGGPTVLRSIEMNLNPRGQGDMDPNRSGGSISFWVRFIPHCAPRMIRLPVTSPPCAIRTSRFWVIRADGFTITASA
jgi:hypothetical protein